MFVGEYVAALIICLMVSGGEALEDYAQVRATKSLSELLERVLTRAHLVNGAGNLIEVKVVDLVPGNVVMVRPGEILPVDGVLLDADRDRAKPPSNSEALGVGRECMLAREVRLGGPAGIPSGLPRSWWSRPPVRC